MKRFVVLLLLPLMGGCAPQLAKFQSWSSNYQTFIATVNADIAATAPTVAAGCADIQKYAMLIVPFIPTNGKAPQYVAAANAAIKVYCSQIPTDIKSTATAVAAAVAAAKAGYANVSR